MLYPPHLGRPTAAEASVRRVAEALKRADPAAVSLAASAMAPLAPPGSVLVPLPDSRGDTGANLVLAREIAARTGARVRDALSRPRGESALAALRMRWLGLVPDAPVVLVDNVVTTGATARAALAAIGRPGTVLAWARAPDIPERARVEEALRRGQPVPPRVLARYGEFVRANPRRSIPGRANPSTPLPARFPETEIGLMTREEYLAFSNPQGKHHPSDSYDIDLGRLNSNLYGVGSLDDREIRVSQVHGESGAVFTRDERVIGVLHDGVLYRAPAWRPLAGDLHYHSVREWIPLKVTEQRVVKYPAEYVGLVTRVAERNRGRYDHVLQNITIQGEPYQVRSEGKPVPDQGTTLAILNSKGEVVAQASNEWGATLLMVAREYRGRGLGPVLGRIWYRLNPSFVSGGFAPAGERNALGMWGARVREFLDRGWYSALVRAGRISQARVREIQAGLAGRRPETDLPAPRPRKAPAEKDLRFLVDDGISFVLYDARALSGDEGDSIDEKYIHAYGFFRDSEPVGVFLYRIDYDQPFRQLATEVALQMARDSGEKVYVGEGYGDLLELEGVPGIRREGDHVYLTKNLLPLRELALRERRARRPLDPYGAKLSSLLEAAEAKWS
jgi:hypothetical protein